MDILNKILLFFFIFSFLNILRHSFFLLRNIRSGERFMLDSKSLILLGVSISYILMSIISGITL
jgi:hypothetical protein